ncbi:hypothetical protein AURDEDRAFT_181371 [Auricularia subglabra TFB-10046 SS5]|nr:hypothetical protein AURDEDRAFT_181371 [Auricularia subglabra TFB-10046 SS5]
MCLAVTHADPQLDFLEHAFAQMYSVAKDHTERLPTELLLQIMTKFNLKQIVRCSHANRHWRVAAFAHETFSRSISISSDAPAAVNMLWTRLRTSPFSDITLHVCAYGAFAGHGHVLPILKAIAEFLPRLKSLDLSVDARHAEDVFYALRGAAPQLEQLRLFFYMRGVDTCRIPTDFLGGYAPNLRVFQATPMRLPSTPPRALSTVTDVGWQDGHILFSPEELVACFPSLHTLRLSCNSYVLQGTVEPLRLMKLDNLVLNAQEAAQHPLIGTFPDDVLRDMSYISMRTPTPACVNQLLAHLGARIRLRLTGEGTTHCTFNADLVDLDRGLVRRFGESEVYYHPAVFEPRLSLLSERGYQWAGRVVEFTLAMSIWHDPRFNQHIPAALFACRQFTLILDTDERDDATELRVKPWMPRVENVILSTPHEHRRIEQKHLVMILSIVLKIGPDAKLKLCEGVRLFNWDPEFPPNFLRIPRPEAFH